MKKTSLLFSILLTLLMFSCGPSAEEDEKQRVQDSIKLESDRVKILEKANAFLDTTQENETKEDVEQPTE